MCNFMSLRVVNLDNRPFYTVVKQIIKKSRSTETREGGWICEEAKIFIFTNTSIYQQRVIVCVGKLCENYLVYKRTVWMKRMLATPCLESNTQR